MEDRRPRLLIFEGHTVRQLGIHEALQRDFQVDLFDRMEDALLALRNNHYDAVFSDAGDFLPIERALVGEQASLVLNTVGEGVCVIDADGIVSWSNKRMRDFSTDVFEKVKTTCHHARSLLGEQLRTQRSDQQPRSKKFSFQANDGRYFELVASPVVDQRRQIRQVVAVVWDATGTQRLQQKINAIDSAGRELTRLDTEQISRLAPDARLQLLQDKIIRYSRDLMHFDHFAIRLLDKRSNKLEVVIAEGMPSEAIEIDIYAHPEGNGISGYVAAAGRSYVCHDTEKDPRYILGIDHSKSSLTVPLWLHDKVIGVFNIESQTVGTFSEDDRQFAEIFGRYVALALNVLELLVIERCTTSGQMADNVVHEMAQPLNDIVTDAQTLMEEYIGDDSMRQRLNKIVDNVQSLRGTIRDVAAGPNTVLGHAGGTDGDDEQPRFSGKRVLIADDESSIRTTIADVLTKHGCVCTACKDGYEAIHELERQTFDVIVTDIKMPHRNGYEIFAAARRGRDDIPVILMTGFGYDPNHSIVRASQDGLCGVLFKPFRVDQLLDRLDEALSAAVDEGSREQSGSPPVDEPHHL